MTAASAGVAGSPVEAPETVAAGTVAAGHDAADPMAALYAAQYWRSVGLAMLLVDDIETAEEVVQDSFAAMHAHWRRLNSSDAALRYLRQCVVNRARSVLRHRRVVDRNVLQPPPDMPSAEHFAIRRLEREAVVAALQRLPLRQREVLVLRYYADLSEADIASAMRISRGTVKSHIFRAMTALRHLLDEGDMSDRRAYRGGSGPGTE